MTIAALELRRDQILAFRRRIGALDERLPAGDDSLRQAAWAGLQDSVPRAALASIHARVAGTGPTTWEDPSLVQIWGPRFSAYLVAAADIAPFTLGRLPADAAGLKRAHGTAARLHAFLDGRTMSYADAGHGLGIDPNALRYAAPTGTVLIRWEGARRPTIWTVPAPQVDPVEALLELARRFLHVFGVGTAESFSTWAGIKPRQGHGAFEALELARELGPVSTPLGDAWMLLADEAVMRTPSGPPAPARLLPSGDTYLLLWGLDRELLAPEADRRPLLWTSRVWPGAVLVGGEVAGTWRRDNANVTIQPWRRLGRSEREAVDSEAASLPLPEIAGAIVVTWDESNV